MASLIPNTIASETVQLKDKENSLEIAHPAGVIEVKAFVEKVNHTWQARSAMISSTARPFWMVVYSYLVPCTINKKN